MEITGKIIVINPEQIITNSFKKREFVIQTFEEYPQSIIMELVNDKCRILDSFQIGTEITVKINLRGRKWTNPQGIDKYFNTLQAWQVFESIGGTQSGEPENHTTPEEEENEADRYDLPF